GLFAPAGRGAGVEHSGGKRLRPRLAEALEPLLDGVPVDDAPPRLEVVRATVLVLEVVRVLPDVDAEQRDVALHDRRVLVGSRIDRESGAVVDEPCPT